MTTKKLFFIPAGVVLAFALTFGATNAYASMQVGKQADQAMTNYFEAYQAKNPQDMLHYVHDSRFKNDAEFVQVYSQLFSGSHQDKVTNFQIVSTHEIDQSHVMVTIAFDSSEVGHQQDTYLVQIEGKQWKVVLNPNEHVHSKH